MLNCKEVSQLIASGEAPRASWPKRMELRLHLMMCKFCRLYEQQLVRIGQMAFQAFGPGTSDPTVLSRLRRKILGEIGESRGGGGGPAGPGPTSGPH